MRAGIATFRECQTKALDAQAETRAALKVSHEASGTGQTELFESLHAMGPNKAAAMRARKGQKAEALVLDLTPKAPDYITYKKLWASVLTKHAVRLTDVNRICANLKKKDALLFPDWEAGKRVPQDHYRTQRPDGAHLKGLLPPPNSRHGSETAAAACVSDGAQSAQVRCVVAPGDCGGHHEPDLAVTGRTVRGL